MVPVSCPPCPASTTILPIFSPSARISERSPAAVGAAVCVVVVVAAGAETRAESSTLFFLFLLDSLGAIDSNVGPLVGWAVVFSELSTAASSVALGGVTLATSAGLSVITRSLSLSRVLPWPLGALGLAVPTPAPFAVSSASAGLIVVTVTSFVASAFSAGALDDREGSG